MGEGKRPRAIKFPVNFCPVTPKITLAAHAGWAATLSKKDSKNNKPFVAENGMRLGRDRLQMQIYTSIQTSDALERGA